MGRAAVVSGVRGGGVTLIGSASTMALQVGSVVVLSRLLAPTDFGLLAMVAVFVALGNLIRDFGMPMAALQAKALSHQQASNLFWVNVLLAGGVGITFAASAPLIVALFAEPRLAQIVPMMALVIVLNGVGAQIQIDLARKMRFAALVLTDLGSQLAGLSSAIAIALSGLGYWALVAQALVAAAVSLVARWLVSGWLPTRFRFDGSSTKLFRAGAEYGVSYLLSFLQSNVDTLVIGARFGAASLGYYNRGYQLLTAPAARVLDPLTQVVITSVNRAQSEGRDANALMLRIQFLIGVAVVWVFAMAGTNASEIVGVFLGPGWGETVGVFRILAIGGAVSVFSHVSYWIFILHEQSRELLKYSLVTKPLAVVLLIAGSSYGIQGVAWGYTAAMLVNWPVNLGWLGKCVGLPSARFALNGLVILASGAAGAVASGLVAQTLGGQPAVVSLCAAIPAGSAVMLAGLLAYPQGRISLLEAVQLLKSMRPVPEARG